MKYSIVQDSYNLSLMKRLLKLRNIEEDSEQFFDPTFKSYWIAGSLLRDFDVGLDRIIAAINHGEKIAIFGDYDVD